MDIEILKSRLLRESSARQQAEELLEKKSHELYRTNQMIRSTADQLAQQSAQLNVILDNTLAGIFLVNSAQVIVRGNRYAERKFAFEADTLFGIPAADLIVESYDKIKPLLAVDQSKSLIKEYVQLTGKRNDGTVFPIELSIANTVLNGQPHSVWFFRDISRLKEEEHERERLEQELRQAHKLESLGTLASGIAHEINTPIQFVGENLHFLEQGFGELLCAFRQKDNPSDEAGSPDIDFLAEEVPAAIAQSLEGISHVREIVLSVRDFSHPGVKEKTPNDINKCIESTVTISTNHWKYVAELDTDLSPGLPLVSCVPGEINQVLLNLIVNAAQAIEESGRKEMGKISISSSLADGHAVIRISDTGCGISSELKDRVFDPFFTTKDIGKGTGQGLSLAHNVIVQKHGGKIFFESEKNAGTTFVVMLPAQIDNEVKLAS